MARDSLLYGGASAFRTCLSLVTFPVLTRHFSVAEYGVIDLFGLMTAFLVIFCAFGQNSALVRFFYDSDAREHRQQVVSQSLLVQLIAVLVILPLPILFAADIGAVVSDSPHASALVWLILLTVPFEIAFYLASVVCKFNFERGKYLFLTIGISLIRVLVLLWAIFVLDIGVIGIFVLNLGTSVVGCCFGILFIRRWIRWPVNLQLARQMIPYAVPFGVITSVSFLFPILQRLFVEDLIGAESLGLYSAGAKVALLISIPILAFETAWGPFALAISRSENAERTYRVVLRIFVLLITPCVMMLDVLGDLVLGLLAGEQYLAGGGVVFPLTLGLAAVAVGMIVALGMTIEKKEMPRLYAFIIYFGVSLGAMWGLGAAYGMVGVAFGALIGQVLLACLLIVFSNRVSTINWKLKRVLLFCVLFIVFGGLVHMGLPVLGDLAPILLSPILVLVVMGCGWLVMFDVDDRRASVDFVHELYRKVRPS